MSDAWLSLLGSIVIAAAGVAGAWLAARSARRQALAQQSSSDRHADHDQIQEDLQAVRDELRAAKAEMRWLRSENRVLDDEVNDLRAAMTAGGLNPPPRRPLPPFPGEWNVTEDRA